MEQKLSTTCCIAGGGPAGMMLGLLLARNGIDVIVLEKHADFFRDFRGDTIHPSTLEIMSELGILDKFLQLPHQKAIQLNGYVESTRITVANFAKLKVHCPYIAIMPQWDFLNFLANTAKQYANFRLHMQTVVTDLLIQNRQVQGVRADTPQGSVVITAPLVIGADGRHSIVRHKAGLEIENIGAPMDVLWFKLSRKDTDPNEMFGKFTAGKIMIMINRHNYWQCGYVVPKGTAQTIQQQQIEIFRKNITDNISFLADRVQELKSFDDIKLLTVTIDRLKNWFMPGLLCIGDSAHAMSPIGGVGINLAIQDAVATANILSKPLQNGSVSIENLHAVQQRRALPTKLLQAIQVLVQKRVIKPVLAEQQPLHLPWLISKIQQTEFFQDLIGYIIGIGIRPEHIQSISKL